MSGLPRIKAVQEFDEDDKSQGVQRTYLYYKNDSIECGTSKQVVDILNTPHWGKMLFLDGVLQSTTKDEVIYHNALVHPLLDTLVENHRILILGGGEGATAREVLRWKTVARVTMVDYDKELVECMIKYGPDWSKGAFQNNRLKVFYQDAWEFMEYNQEYNGIIVDLTDPDCKKERWLELLNSIMKCIKKTKGGFVMNAGLYLPWDTGALKELVELIKGICYVNKDFKYYIYTVFIPSFSGEWTFILVSHTQKFMLEPEFSNRIPAWIRRGIKILPESLLQSVNTNPDTTPILP